MKEVRMKIFDRLFRKKITSEQAILEFKNCIETGKSVMKKHSMELFNAAFPENDATELAVNIMKREFKRLDEKLTRKEQQLFFKSIYLKCMREQKFSHHIGHKVDKNLVLLIMWHIIDQTTIKEIESAYERDGIEALDRYTESYQKYYLKRWLLYALIDVGLKLAYENFFGREIEEALVEQFKIINDSSAEPNNLDHRCSGFTIVDDDPNGRLIVPRLCTYKHSAAWSIV
jgi:hypothetical protein